jgi:ornithine carbamoyltransferase
MTICAKLGVDFSIVSPKELFPDAEIQKICAPFASASGAVIKVSDSLDAVLGADAVYTDVWVSMGEEALKAERVRLLSPYQVNAGLIERTGKKSTIFLHCLPAVKGEEVSFDLIEGSRSRVWDQAENRKHTIKAIMLGTLD